ncbi:MAG: class I SAM-dependent methyltransferase [Ignavibacterium sp.]|nr:class I SAM-dependent methyltransferase [Ignavibacterium sp.]
MNCRICNSEATKVFDAKVLNKFSVSYFKCGKCCALFTEKPYWLDEAYARTINLSDTGLLARNLYFSQIISVLLFFEFDRNAKYLDYAGGYGVFTRLMRDIGFDFYWNDPYTQNLLANGFEYNLESNIRFELLTAFEVFEHLENPNAEIEKILTLSDSIAFSTELLPDSVPDMNWWYYGFDHGQHITFYSAETFFYLAQKFNLYYYKLNGIQLLTRKKLNKDKIILLKKIRNYGPFQMVKKKMKSKTFSDHLNLRIPK